jgi:hypothetical protein
MSRVFVVQGIRGGEIEHRASSIRVGGRLKMARPINALFSKPQALLSGWKSTI